MNIQEQQNKERIAKLPKWARDLIQQRESSIAYLERQIVQMEQGDTDTFFDYSHPKGLPEGVTVMFHIRGGEINCHTDGGRLQIRAYSDSGDFMGLLPQASNSFAVTFTERRADKEQP